MSGQMRHHGEPEPSYRFRTTIDIRFRDIDALGHVNNAVYFTYLEIARSAYFGALLGRPLVVEDFSIVVAEAQCRYRSPAFYGERLVIEMAAVGVRSRSFELRYRISVEETGRLVAEARTVQVAYDHQAKRSTAFSPEFRRQVERFEGRALDS